MSTTATEPKSDKTTTTCDRDKVKVGDFFTAFYSGTVLGRVGDRFKVTNGKTTYEVSADILETENSFADQSEQTVKVNQTEMIAVLMGAPRSAMTVNFNKQPDEAEVAKFLRLGQDNTTDRAWKSKVKVALEGEERTMVGYHEGALDERGRLKFYEHGAGFRLVDPRRLNWLVVRRVRYELK